MTILAGFRRATLRRANDALLRMTILAGFRRATLRRANNALLRMTILAGLSLHWIELVGVGVPAEGLVTDRGAGLAVVLAARLHGDARYVSGGVALIANLGVADVLHIGAIGGIIVVVMFLICDYVENRLSRGEVESHEAVAALLVRSAAARVVERMVDVQLDELRTDGRESLREAHVEKRFLAVLLRRQGNELQRGGFGGD